MATDSMTSRWITAVLLLLWIVGAIPANSFGQANIAEEHQVIKTYPFGDPNPVPIMASNNPHIYPYFTYDEYSQSGADEEWKVIRMENEFIEVYILPEVGGKVWGAVEKSTGKEFIYQNSANKFRNIALRGPWTSGGIEFNFGIVGHTPSTATPVDYKMRKNPDGSVSTIVGSIDLPSRTEWRVEITLPEDKAYFETKSFWYNPTPLEQSNYVWLTAAARVSDDLKFYYPGEYAVGHAGDVQPWPIDEEGRDLSLYKNNDFGSHRSIHVVGEKAEHFGGYWLGEDFGFGNWSLYNDMPGKKLWLWAQSRSGAIWEDLLTDNDGQYMEFQSGRLFSQTTGGTAETPFDYDAFEVGASDTWKELWFPVKETGGISAASPHGVLHVEEDNRDTIVKLMALQSIDDDLTISIGDSLLSSTRVSLDPIELYQDTLSIAGSEENVRIELGQNKLVFDAGRDASLDRPLENDLSLSESTAGYHVQRARNEVANRNYEAGLEEYHAAIEKDPALIEAHAGLATLYYRRGEYQKALDYAREALSHNTYDSDANYIYGIVKNRIEDDVEALEALGWAARSLKYRSSAYATMAEIYLENGQHDRAIEFANRSLDFNAMSVNAHKVLAVSYRKKKEVEQAHAVLDNLLEIDPLNHFTNFERYLLDQSNSRLSRFNSMIQDELPHERYLELGIYYANMGLNEEAIRVLNEAPENPIVYYWLAYLGKDDANNNSRNYLDSALKTSPYLVFPSRLETLPVLKWAGEQIPSWQSPYYLGLIYWSVGRLEDAEQQFARVDDESDFAAFYLSRGKLRQSLNADPDIIYEDFETALSLDLDEWRSWNEVNNFYLDEGPSTEALDHSQEAYERFPDNDAIAMDYARALLQNRKFKTAVDHLEEIQILPSEHTRGTRTAYEQAATFSALESIRDRQFEEAQLYLDKARTWPENLGVGRPYDPDLRLQDMIEAAIYQQLGHHPQAEELYDNIIAYTESFPDHWGAGHYAAVIALENMGRNNEAQKLLEAWQEAQPDDIMARWASADFKGEDERRQQIANQSSDSISFQLLVESVNSIRELITN